MANVHARPPGLAATADAIACPEGARQLTARRPHTTTHDGHEPLTPTHTAAPPHTMAPKAAHDGPQGLTCRSVIFFRTFGSRGTTGRSMRIALMMETTHWAIYQTVFDHNGSLELYASRKPCLLVELNVFRIIIEPLPAFSSFVF